MKKFATAFLSVAAAASLCSAATPRILTADAQRARAIGVCIDGRAVLRTDDAALSKAAPRKAPVKRAATKIYPNDPCPCGSGKKYKQCCGKKGS